MPDILTKIDGLPIEASATEDEDIFPAMIRQYDIDATIELTVLRPNGAGWSKPQIKKLKLPQAPKTERELQTYRRAGLEFCDIIDQPLQRMVGVAARVVQDALQVDPDSIAIVRAVLRLADALRMSTTAEGIETVELATTLATLGCASGQGFYFARPLEAEAALDYWKSRKRQ